MTFIPAKPLEDIEISLIRQWNQRAKPDTINLAIGQLPWKAPKAVIEAAIHALELGKITYTVNAGLLELREAIAGEFQQKNNRSVSQENVIVTCGVQQALHNTFTTFLNKGDEVLLPEIGFLPAYEALTKLRGAKPVKYNLDMGFGLDLEDISRKVTPRTRLIVTNSPSNPTGRILDSYDLNGLVEILERNPNLYVLSDEIYSKLYFDSVPESIAKYHERVIVADGISKRSSATGLRIGWTVAPIEVTKQMLKIQQQTVTCAPTPFQYAAIPVVLGECAAEEENYRSDLKRNRDLLLNGLFDLHLPSNRPSGAFYFFPDISRYGGSEEVAGRILEIGNVLTIPGRAFGEPGNRNIRISYAVDKETLEKGIQGILRTLK